MEKVANSLCSQHDATSKAVSESPSNYPTVRKSEGSHGCSPSTFSEKYLPRRKVNVRLKDAKANLLETAKKDAIIGHHKNTSPGLKLFPREQHPPTNEKVKLGQKRKVETPRSTNSPREDSTSESKAEQRESEKLQKKMNEISQQMSLYEKKIQVLKEENESLMKKKSEDSRGADDKIRLLTRRNVDLTNSVRRLEEQLKQAQQEFSTLHNPSLTIAQKNSPTLDRTSSSPHHQQQQHKNKQQQQQHDLSTVNNSNNTVQQLHMKFQQLLNHLNSISQEQNSLLTKDEAQLQSIIKSSAKERLQLEKELAMEKQKSKSSSSKEQTEVLETKIAQLEKELGDLQKHVGDKEKLEVETVQKSIAIETLEKRLESYKSKMLSLEMDLMSARDQNIQLSVNNSDLQKQLELHVTMEKENHVLKEKLGAVEGELKSAKEKIRNLEDALNRHQEKMGTSETRRIGLEDELMKLSRELNDKEATLESIEKSQKKKIDDLQKFGEELKLKLFMVEDEKESLREENERLLRQLKGLESTHEFFGKSKSDLLRDFDNRDSLNNNNNQNGDDADSEGNSVKALSISPGDSNPNELQDSMVSTSDPSEVHIFQALYNYDPNQYSPNEQPSEELQLTSGDFVVVYGDMDEDGFYYGESMEGQKGFIPSNFVRKLSENEKADFFKIINMDLLDPQLNSNPKVLLPPLGSEAVPKNSNKSPPRSVTLQNTVLPDPPVSINVEVSKDGRTLVASWLPVTIAIHGTSNGVRVAGYYVYIDGRRAKVVNNPTDDQVEIRLDEIGATTLPRYVTLRTLASNGNESSDSAPFFLSYGSTPNIIFETPKNGKDLAVEKVDRTQGSFQSLSRDDDYDLPDKPWKNLPSRQSLDFQATQQFQALYRSASVNDAHPLAHESVKFNSDSGLLGEEKLTNHFDEGTKSLEANLCNGNGHASSPDRNRFPTLQQQVEAHSRGRTHPIDRDDEDFRRSKDDYRNIILTDNDVVTSVNIRDDIPDSELIDYEDDAPESLVDDTRDSGRVRIFIALFSYDPLTMSPNPDATDVELKFREGQIIKIFGSKDEDGFFLGEAGGRRGLVPCNMVSEVEVDDPHVADELLLESNRQVMQSALGMNSEASSPASSHQNEELKREDEYGVSPQDMRYMVAVYDYDALELSPNTDVEQELSFRQGDVIEVFGEVDGDGFYYGRVRGTVGLVPSNFVKEFRGDTLI